MTQLGARRVTEASELVHAASPAERYWETQAVRVREVVRQLDEHAPDAVILVATNPVDVMTRLAARFSRRPRARVIGTGTTLDSARLRALIGAELSRSLKRRAKKRLGLGALRAAHAGAVSVIRRGGSAPTLNVQS